jgi:predicted AAA+ superfamily ATPase
MFESQAGIIPFAKPVVTELLANMSKDEITNLAKNVAKSAVQDIMVVMKGKIDLDSFLSWFETLMKKAFIEINHTTENNDSTHRYTVKHNLGENWALPQ